MFWRKKRNPPPVPTAATPAPAGAWLCEQVFLWFGGALPAGIAPDHSHTIDAKSGLAVHGFASPTVAREFRQAGGSRMQEVRDPPVMARLRAQSGNVLSAGLAQTLEWDLSVTDRIQLAETLSFVRDLVRPRLPSPVAGGLPVLCIDRLVRSGPGSFHVHGWWRNRTARVARLAIISPEGLRAELLHGLSTVARRDIPAIFPGDSYTGFLTAFDLPCDNLLDSGWLMELETADGFVCEAPVPPALTEPGEAIAAVLPDLELESPPNPFGVAGHVDRTVSLLLARRRASGTPVESLAFGPSPAAPQLSVIVPLFKRVDLLEHQLAAFAQDPDWRNCELIYVLDSPEDAAALRLRADGLFALYGVSFRLILPGHTGGYAVANNLGVRHARASLLLLLNSDVLPVAPGWLPRLIAAYRRRGNVGAMGPKLLFEDGSIQHAGEGYRAMGDGFGWEADPFFKGMHRELAAANQPRRVPAVTGACLLVARADFLRVGGFDEGYVQGDYEDLDLCRRLAAAGLHNWYEPGIELYHLEGASYPSRQRAANLRYNRWRHSQVWGDEIAAMASARETKLPGADPKFPRARIVA